MIRDVVPAAVGEWAGLGAASEPKIVAAPGRVNILGEHTDYNSGLCLPIAANLHVVVAASAGTTPVLHLSEREEEVAVPLDADLGNGAQGAGPSWVRLALAVARELAALGRPERGLTAGIGADLPEGAGMSSSAAFEIAIALALCTTAGWQTAPSQLAEAARRAEHAAFGVPCGILDQTAVIFGVAGNAILLDCGTGDRTPVGLPEDMVLVVADSGVRRSLAESAYADRVAECREACRLLGVEQLREVGSSDLPEARRLLPDSLFRRTRHVVSENGRVAAAVGADAAGLGSLVSDSGRSLRDDYEVSQPSIDMLVDDIESIDGALGARIMGAGFGGSVLAVAERAAGDRVADAARRLTGEQAWITEAVEGAGVVEDL